jgi:peptidoglycan/LPS O-acetylase OafA/YrhL
LLTIPLFGSLGFEATRLDGAAWWFTFTPLHILWAGGEAVFVFFVLSGVVLALPALRGRHFSWIAYYPTRIVRIYLPVVLALLFTLVAIAVVPRTLGAAHGPWDAAHVQAVTPASLLRDAVLLTGVDDFNTPLWSLQWEVAFSLLLPLYILIAIKFRRFSVLLVGGALVCVLLGALTDRPWLTLLPMFALGAVIAANRTAIMSRADRYAASRGWWVVLGLSICALTSRWWLARAPRPIASYAIVLEAAGAALIVVMAMMWPRARQVLDQRAIQWLGTISFSLYLTHEPVVVSVSFLLPASLAWLTPLIGIPISLVIGWGFFKLAESPSHRLAQMVSRAIKARSAQSKPVPRLGN